MIEVLDTRFFIEHFFSTDPVVREKTRNRVTELRRRKEGVVPLIVIAEFADQACRFAGRREAEETSRAIVESGLQIRPLDPDMAIAAGARRCSNRRVPLADCIVATVADHVGGRVVSDDPHFKQLRGIRVAWL
ncbi:MAG: PIN domain-containing protein [Methanobacteriota archaeon]